MFFVLYLNVTPKSRKKEGWFACGGSGLQASGLRVQGGAGNICNSCWLPLTGTVTQYAWPNWTELARENVPFNI